MFIIVIITQLIMGLLEKFFPLHDPQKPLYQEKLHTSQRARIEWVKDRSIQQSLWCDSQFMEYLKNYSSYNIM